MRVNEQAIHGCSSISKQLHEMYFYYVQLTEPGWRQITCETLQLFIITVWALVSCFYANSSCRYLTSAPPTISPSFLCYQRSVLTLSIWLLSFVSMISCHHIWVCVSPRMYGLFSLSSIAESSSYRTYDVRICSMHTCAVCRTNSMAMLCMFQLHV